MPRLAPEDRWTESDSQAFIEQGAVFTPNRDGVSHAIVDLLKMAHGAACTIVDIACGDGWLSETLLEAFPNASVVALDGSEAMLNSSADRLRRFGSRVRLSPFSLESHDWVETLSEPVSAFVSSLALHHLGDEGKAMPYKRLFRKLEVPGAFVVFDLIAPASPVAWDHAANEWDRFVERRSLEIDGSDRALRSFQDLRWNFYRYPDDPIDQPATIANHLRWLDEAGFTGSDVFSLFAGHALFGGFKTSD